MSNVKFLNRIDALMAIVSFRWGEDRFTHTPTFKSEELTDSDDWNIVESILVTCKPLPCVTIEYSFIDGDGEPNLNTIDIPLERLDDASKSNLRKLLSACGYEKRRLWAWSRR